MKKVIRTINSCRTFAQFNNARNYAELYLKNIGCTDAEFFDLMEAIENKNEYIKLTYTL